MNKATEFLREETINLEITLRLIEELLCKDSLSLFHRIALGTLLQNIYMGIENTLRCRLEQRKIRLPKSASWHKDMLMLAQQVGLITDAQWSGFLDLLLFRHAHAHGYGHMLDEPRLRELAAPVPALCREYLREMAVAENL